MVYRPKWQIALELYDRSVTEGVCLPWITADEGYGGKPGFLEGLQARQQRFVLEVPRSFSVWEKAPEVTAQPYRKRGRGRGRPTPRIKSGQSQPRSVEQVFYFSEAMKSQRWRNYRIKGSDDLPGMQLCLLVARNPLDDELKFFVSNAEVSEPITRLLLVAFQRWRVERCFEDQKQEVGLDCFEGRKYIGLKRHLILTAISYLFLSRICQQEREKKSAVDHSTVARRHRRDRRQLVPAC